VKQQKDNEIPKAEIDSFNKEEETKMYEKKKYTYEHNNSTDYYSQINNERDPYVSCFNTSMINVGLNIMKLEPPTEKAKTGGYKQPEDQFDYFMHTDKEVVSFTEEYKAKNAWAKDYDPRELWEVEVFAFNKWIGRKVCRVCYNMKRRDFYDEIQNGRGVVTTGKFCGYGHAVSVVGFKAEIADRLYKDVKISGDNISILVGDNDITEIIIDDSYGNPNANYKPVGVGGNDVHMPREKLFECIDKSGNKLDEKYYGILFDLA